MASCLEVMKGRRGMRSILGKGKGKRALGLLDKTRSNFFDFF
jgi:hypothetical protein